MGFFILLTLVLGTSGFLVSSALIHNPFLPFIVGGGLATLPALYVLRKKKKRMAKFEKQLPEALELIARALRAGHAFTSGMKLAATEFGDPLGPEFDATLDEINFGQSVPDALKFLAQRVDCADLKFFIVSVILQRETGGNLAEIIENLAHLIRERFKFRGKVRVLSAEGRLSAIILMILPILLGLFLVTFHTEVVSPLWLDPVGRILAVTEAILMVSGFIMIRKIIKVDV
jgi:tight adherence protein B